MAKSNGCGFIWWVSFYYFSQGTYGFSGVAVAEALGAGVIATRAALRRSRHKVEISMPTIDFKTPRGCPDVKVWL